MKHQIWRILKNPYDRNVFAAMLALEILMSFSFLGYLRFPNISITFAFIPILVAAVFQGPLSATCIGAVFGLCSLYKSSAYFNITDDIQIFSPFLSGEPVESFLLSVGCRILFGIIVGLLIYWAKHSHYPALFIGIIAALSRRLHSVIVCAAMGLFFPEQGQNLLSGLSNPPEFTDIILSIICVLIVEIIWAFSCSTAEKNLRKYIELENEITSNSKKYKKRSKCLFLVFITIVICALLSSVIYFVQRISQMMSAYGLQPDSAVKHNLINFSIQFSLAVLSLAVMVWILFITIYKSLLYREYLGQLDSLTGVMGRRMFLDYCDRLFKKSNEFEQCGCFLFVDVDQFKKINDKLGHPAGDMVLQKIAENLQKVFDENGHVGRIGGDEFAVVLDRFVSYADLEKFLNQFQKETTQILPEPICVTCSIGGYYYSYPADLNNIYKEVDKLLYKAKQRGRAQYIIGGEKI